MSVFVKTVGAIFLCIISMFFGVDPVYADCEQIYVLKSKVNVRSGSGTGHAVVGSFVQNTTLFCQEKYEGWVKVQDYAGFAGWVREDLVSGMTLAVHLREREIVVLHNGDQVMRLPITPGGKGLGEGRYFAQPDGRQKLLLTWPNRQDLRQYLLQGHLTYPKYKDYILNGMQVSDKNGLALCSGFSNDPSCGVILAPNDYSRLIAEVPEGVRVDIYRDANEDRELRRSDELSRRIYQGALKQLEYPAAGLKPDGKSPSLSYPGGDIQPDFAASSDIVIRAVRYAGLDLQALVHEDYLLHPERYDEFSGDGDVSSIHRSAQVLFVYFSQNALSLAVDVKENPFSFEAGDIVFFATGLGGGSVPDRIGIVSDNYNSSGYPKIITVWDMGQSTRLYDVLGRKNKKVIGHFRMTYLYDYH